MLIKLLRDLFSTGAENMNVRGRPGELCPVCSGSTVPHDTVDFNKSCVDTQGTKPFADSGVGIEYRLCQACGHCFAPEFLEWSVERFSREIYNSEYFLVDPDAESLRPMTNADFVHSMFGAHADRIRHLDYGGGSGLLSGKLKALGWDSSTYDPFHQKEAAVGDLGKFDLITAFEVFEHVPHHQDLLDDLACLSYPGTVILFSTLLSDGNIDSGKPLDWWYASPRNGHVTLFSSKSLSIALASCGLTVESMNPGLHLARYART